MRLWLCGLAFALVPGACAPSLAQQPAGPATLENLLRADDAQQPADPPVDEATDAGPKPPAATVDRPKDGVRHPELDKAWADYGTAVANVSASIRAVLAKQFDAATAKGDLDAAVKWQEAQEKFEAAGELPADAEIKAAMSAAAAGYRKAREELAKAYEGVVKSLTMEKRLAEARAARDEARGLAKDRMETRQSTAQPERKKTRDKTVDLLGMVDPARDAVMGRWTKQADGSVGFAQQGSPNGKLEIPFQPTTGEYDLLVEVDVLGGARHVVLYVVVDGQSRFFILKPGSVENLGYVPGARCDLAQGRTHKIVVQVRAGDIGVSVDDERVAVGRAERMNDYWRLRGNRGFGIGAHESSLVFRSVRLAVP